MNWLRHKLLGLIIGDMTVIANVEHPITFKVGLHRISEGFFKNCELIGQEPKV